MHKIRSWYLITVFIGVYSQPLWSNNTDDSSENIFSILLASTSQLVLLKPDFFFTDLSALISALIDNYSCANDTDVSNDIKYKKGDVIKHGKHPSIDLAATFGLERHIPVVSQIK